MELLSKQSKAGAMVYSPCARCLRERWVVAYKLKQGKGVLCHRCYMQTMHRPNKKGVWAGDKNPRWNGGRRTRQSDGYVAIRALPDNPYYDMRMADGYILEHRLRMAESVGRCLRTEEIVHHVDGDRSNNVIENLELTIRGEHRKSYSDGYNQGYIDGLRKNSPPMITVSDR